ncbi:MAG: putative metal-binding motif-containing protein, partial [Archangium sp.]
ACSGASQICVRTSGPVTETCNNVDDDCDGTTDEGNPGGGGTCTVPNKQGACATGENRCTSGAQVCTQTNFPATEVCDSVDNDCNGVVDNGFAGLGATCTAGVGVCSRSGTNVCNGAGTGGQGKVTAGSPTAAACDGLDNDCDGVTDEPVLSSTAAVSSVGYSDIEVQPFYYSASCQGGALGSGTDALTGGAMIMGGPTVDGVTFQRLNADGTAVAATSSAITLPYTDIDLAQAGAVWLVAGVWAYNNAEIDLYVLDANGAKLAQKWTQFKISSTTTLDSLRLVRGNGRKATLVWRENGTGIKAAKIEACWDGTTWTIQQAGCTSGAAALTSTTIVANTAVVPGIGADSNVIDWAASQSCQSTTALRTVGISYRAGTNALRFFTMNDDGTGKSGETTFTPVTNSTATAEPAVGFFKDGSNVDAYVVSFVVQFASSSSARYWRSNNPATFDRVWSGSDATGATAIKRPRVSAKADGFQIVALREFESEPTYPTQLMTRNYTLAGVATPAGQPVEIAAGCAPGDTACSAGNKAAVANAYPWGRVYYSSTAASAASFGSALTCN